MNGDPVRHSRSAVPAFGRHLLAPRYWPAWLVAGLVSLPQLLPRSWRDALGAAAGEINYRLKPKRLATARVNLGMCFPDWSDDERERLARAHFRAYGRALLDLPRLWWDRRGRVPARDCDVSGMEHIERAWAAGRSVILLSPHTVAVDFGGVALTPHFPMSSMANQLGHPVADWLVARGRANTGGTMFARDDGLRPVIRALRAGTVFYYMPDEDLGTRDSVFAPFFGQPKATLSTLGRLARIGDTAVIPINAWYAPENRRYEIAILPPLDGFPSGDELADATAMNQALEQVIRLRPEAYMWTFRLFRTQPDNGRSPYSGKRRAR